MHCRAAVGQRQTGARYRQPDSRGPVKQTHSKPVSGFLLNRYGTQLQPLDRHVAFLPRDHRRPSIEDLVIEISDNPILLVDHVSEAPILTVRRLEASPAVLDFEASHPPLNGKPGQLKLIAESHLAVRQLPEVKWHEPAASKELTRRWVPEDARHAPVR